jgi:hypothetical protein
MQVQAVPTSSQYTSKSRRRPRLAIPEAQENLRRPRRFGVTADIDGDI